MIDELKVYLRIDLDATEEDALLQGLIGAAKIQIKAATGKDIDETNEIHKLAVYMLVTHWYENRNVIVNATRPPTEIPHTLTPILLTIEWSD
ncbi:head-tail connector protein [Paenibacillus sp. TAB 01]|uniref:head-tail connector protein n=1 Tax=Paenibacillus sp. TAB 01 TaxID=3368988 RepID=UPI00375027EB